MWKDGIGNKDRYKDKKQIFTRHFPWLDVSPQDKYSGNNRDQSDSPNHGTGIMWTDS